MVVFFYGGGWREGNKEDCGFVASSLTDAGSVVLIPDYRVFPEVVFPQFVEDGADSANLTGFNGLSGPYNFLPIQSGYLFDVFPKDKHDAIQPINFVTDTTPPALLIHGTGDDVVLPSNSESMAKRLSEHGVDVMLKLYKGVGHAKVAVELSPPLDFTGETLTDTLEFLKTAVNKKAS